MLARLAALLAAVVLLPAAEASAAGFSRPATVAAHGSAPVVAVAPTGRMAVVWATARGLAARVGAGADALGPRRDVASGRLASQAMVVVAPSGTAGVCWQSGPAVRCSSAAPGARFGKPRTVAARGEIDEFEIDGAGHPVLVWSQRPRAGRRAWVAAIGDGGGRFGAPRTLAETAAEENFDLGRGPAGAVVATWPAGPSSVGAATLTAGSPRFGAPSLINTAVPFSGKLTLVAGAAGVIWRAFNGSGLLVPQPDGTLARVDPVAAGEQPLATVATGDGALLSLGWELELDDTDCSAPTVSRLHVNTVPGSITLLSDPGQLARFASLRTLDDGSAVAVWGDAIDGNGTDQLEYAVKPPAGTFSAPVAFGPPAAEGPAFETAGSHAVLAYLTGARHRLVVSELRTAPPYAPQATRPAHPYYGCFY